MTSRPVSMGLFLMLMVTSMLLVPSLGFSNDAERHFPQKINHFFSSYCFSCHGPDKQKGDFRIDNLSQDIFNGQHTEDWHEILDILNLGEMPPEKKKQPSREEKNEVIDFLTQEFKKAKEKSRSTGGKVVLRRLTNYEYNNSLNDLLDLNINFSKDFPPDSYSEEGFKNNGSYMGMSSLQIENYLNTAAYALDKAIFTGAQPKTRKADLKSFQEKSKKDQAKQKKNQKKKKGKNKLGNEARLHWKAFPREGPLLIKVALVQKSLGSSSNPELALKIGYHVDTTDYQFKDVSQQPKTSLSGNIHTFEYNVNVENFPLPAPSGKYPALIVAAEGPSKYKIENISIEGPYYETWPPNSHKKVFIHSNNQENSKDYAKEILAHFTSRAWRRPIAESELKNLLNIFQETSKTFSFEESIKKTLVRVLISPEFLFLLEPKAQNDTKEELSNYEFASRLSYFLWSSLPDSTLMNLSHKGLLNQEEIIRKEVRRLLQSPKAWGFINNFTTQWLELNKMDSVAINPEYYPDFDNRLKKDMKHETLNFFAHILRNNLSALNFIDSNFTLANQRLSKHYNLKNPAPSLKFSKVELSKDDQRGGVLSHGSIHLANSNGEDSHAIYRGVWLVDRLLGNPPPSPPANVPEIDETVEGFAKMSLKQQLAMHVADPDCARCHQKIDPYGIPFENFDAIGLWRDEVKRVDHSKPKKKAKGKKSKPMPEYLYAKVDATTALADATKIDGLDGLKRYLLEHESEAFAKNLVEKILAYGLGRSVDFSDEKIVTELTQNFIKDDFKVGNLIEEIVLCDLFKEK